jgi:hypothetical protein
VLLQYALLEERYGLAKHAMEVYERAVKAVPKVRFGRRCHAVVDLSHRSCIDCIVTALSMTGTQVYCLPVASTCVSTCAL